MADRKKLLPTGGQYGWATNIFSNYCSLFSSSLGKLSLSSFSLSSSIVLQ
jgi:hypothetical protein